MCEDGTSSYLVKKKKKEEDKSLRNQNKFSEFLFTIHLNQTLCLIEYAVNFGVYVFYVLITVQYLNSLKYAKIKCLIKIACCFQHLCSENNGPLECKKLVKFSNILRMTESSVKSLLPSLQNYFCGCDYTKSIFNCFKI